MFQQYLKEKKKQIEKNLHAFINRQNKSLDKSCVWGRDVLNRLDEFIPRGKSVRGALVYLGRDVTNNEYTPAVDNAALAMEFFQAGFLIHDDIMDHDELRRGHPSIHRQYQMVLNHNHIKNSKDTGVSLAVCAGDAAFFYGYQLLSPYSSIQNLCSQELTRVVFAQIQDVYAGVSNEEESIDAILSLYADKTGRYSIALPLLVGAMLGSANNNVLKHLRTFGKNLGIAYQLVDDLLNVSGDPTVTGKPVGSDAREHKQTAYNFYLKKTGHKTAAEKKIYELVEHYTKTGLRELNTIHMSLPLMHVFQSLTDYLVNRKK